MRSAGVACLSMFTGARGQSENSVRYCMDSLHHLVGDGVCWLCMDVPGIALHAQSSISMSAHWMR